MMGKLFLEGVFVWDLELHIEASSWIQLSCIWCRSLGNKAQEVWFCSPSPSVWRQVRAWAHLCNLCWGQHQAVGSPHHCWPLAWTWSVPWHGSFPVSLVPKSESTLQQWSDGDRLERWRIRPITSFDGQFYWARYKKGLNLHLFSC